MNCGFVDNKGLVFIDSASSAKYHMGTLYRNNKSNQTLVVKLVPIADDNNNNAFEGQILHHAQQVSATVAFKSMMSTGTADVDPGFVSGEAASSSSVIPAGDAVVHVGSGNGLDSILDSFSDYRPGQGSSHGQVRDGQPRVDQTYN